MDCNKIESVSEFLVTFQLFTWSTLCPSGLVGCHCVEVQLVISTYLIKYFWYWELQTAVFVDSGTFWVKRYVSFIYQIMFSCLFPLFILCFPFFFFLSWFIFWCTWASSGCGVAAALRPAAQASHGGGFSLQSAGSGHTACASCGTRVARGILHTRGRAHVPRIGRGIIIHRKVLKDMFRLIPFSCRTQKPVF